MHTAVAAQAGFRTILVTAPYTNPTFHHAAAVILSSHGSSGSSVAPTNTNSIAAVCRTLAQNPSDDLNTRPASGWAGGAAPCGGRRARARQARRKVQRRAQGHSVRALPVENGVEMMRL